MVFLIAITSVYADKDLEIISPLGAVIRSAVISGYGQFHIGKKIHGIFSFLTTYSFLTGSFITWSSYREVYNNDYIPAAQKNLYSPEARKYYNEANEKYKLSQFLLFTGIGFWTYSLIDSYVGANFYNAELKANQLLREMKPMEDVEIEISMIDQQVSLKLEKRF
jgi:TM2 domain-containing membrane protein YozV